MHIKYLLVIFLVLFSIESATGQDNESKNKFTLNGELVGKDTGAVVLWYFGHDNKTKADTFYLNKGKFHFSGTVNGVCEALLWTDLKNLDFDDRSVIRFLLEPGNIVISYQVKKFLNPVIKGSRSQLEKEKWDKQKTSQLSKRTRIRNSLDSLRKLSKNNIAKKVQINQLLDKIENVSMKIRLLDVQYIRQHPNSYVSAYLLSNHIRKLPLDSAEKYYSNLKSNIRKSSVGHLVLLYIYPLTNHKSFRVANPLVDEESSIILNKYNSVYDLNLRDTAGNKLDLSEYKGKYLFIDFWASWCGPCIANIPALNRLTDDYKDFPIQFVSISLDLYSDDWREAIIKYGLKGPQLSDLKGYTGLAAAYCKVLWVPKYIIVDTNGKIINYDTPQPIEPALKSLLNNLLKRS